MTKEELKEKIINVLSFVDLTTTFTTLDKKLIADALIEAGIGDVETTQKIDAHATAMAVLQEAKAEHRLEVAEKALNLCETAYVLAINGMKTHGISLQAITSDLGIHGFFMRQAEKELAEERREP